MTTTTREQVQFFAKQDAATFAEEFPGETLSPTCDWDAEAFHSRNLPDSAWPTYESTLRAEIERLAIEEASK